MADLELITPDEAADLLRVSRRQLLERIAKKPGFPLPYKPAGKRLWHRPDVMEYIKHSRVGQQSR